MQTLHTLQRICIAVKNASTQGGDVSRSEGVGGEVALVKLVKHQWRPFGCQGKYILFCLCLSVEKLISCQADLSDRRVVSPKAGAELAASLGLQYFESSAKDQTGVEVRILKSPSQFSAFYFDIFWPSADIEKLNCPPGTFLLLSKRVAQASRGASSRDGRNCLRSYLIIFDHI